VSLLDADGIEKAAAILAVITGPVRPISDLSEIGI
jgi:hypothetical protein